MHYSHVDENEVSVSSKQLLDLFLRTFDCKVDIETSKMYKSELGNARGGEILRIIPNDVVSAEHTLGVSEFSLHKPTMFAQAFSELYISTCSSFDKDSEDLSEGLTFNATEYIRSGSVLSKPKPNIIFVTLPKEQPVQFSRYVFDILGSRRSSRTIDSITFFGMGMKTETYAKMVRDVKFRKCIRYTFTPNEVITTYYGQGYISTSAFNAISDSFVTQELKEKFFIVVQFWVVLRDMALGDNFWYSGEGE